MSQSDTYLWSNLHKAQWGLSDMLELSGIFSTLEIAVRPLICLQHSSKTNPVILTADGESSWSLLSSSLYCTISHNKATWKH